MPFIYQYIIEKDKFDKRILSELQHRIRVPLKCYTISSFKLTDNNSFEFKKTYRKLISGNKIVIVDKELHHGSYIKEELSDSTYRITLTFND